MPYGKIGNVKMRKRTTEEKVMKKKSKPLLICLLILFFIPACFYNKWQTIHIEDCGKLKIPEECSYFVEDDKVYIVDEEQNPVMIETFSYPGTYEWEHGEMDENKYYSEIVSLECLQSEGFSNSAIYGTYLMEVNGEKTEKYFISLPNENEDLDLIVWDPTIDLKQVKKIARSFEMD